MGGAYSNHIAATAYAAHLFGLKSIGIIRGEELAGKSLNPTLAKAQSLGMQLHFVSRHEYRLRDEANYLQNNYSNNFRRPISFPKVVPMNWQFKVVRKS